MGLFDTAAIKLTEQGLDAAWYKQQVISHNLSNISTPDYKAKTVDFGLILKEKMKCPYHGYKACDDDLITKRVMKEREEREEMQSATVTGSGASSGNDKDLLWVTTTYETNTNQILNGNNVDMEKEARAMADVQYQYGTMIDYMNSQYSMIRTAIGK
ncbi:MAG: hypothetical protein NC120_01480 [Ruminococcus sp.]|nr:hypothetical protein [Ruminococcus sp.]